MGDAEHIEQGPTKDKRRQKDSQVVDLATDSDNDTHERSHEKEAKRDQTCPNDMIHTEGSIEQEAQMQGMKDQCKDNDLERERHLDGAEDKDVHMCRGEDEQQTGDRQRQKNKEGRRN